MASTSSSPVQRFNGFEVDPRSREISRNALEAESCFTSGPVGSNCGALPRSCIVRGFDYVFSFPQLGRTATLRALGAVALCRSGSDFRRPLLASVRPYRQQDSAFQKRSRLHALSHRTAHLGFRVGSAVPGQGHPRATFARPGSRFCFLGILRLCPGHSEPRGRCLRSWISRSQGDSGALLLLPCRCFCHRMRNQYPRPVCPPIPGASSLARRKAFLWLGCRGPADLPFNGHLPRLIPCDRRQPLPLASSGGHILLRCLCFCP